MEKPFYITTPIYYVNDRPHIGHAYSTVAADTLARYQRLRGRKVRFHTGTDEHGQKIEKAADEQGVTPQQLVDATSPHFKEAFERLDCTFDDYIRTTESRHKEQVSRLWTELVEKGDIYEGDYEGWYSIADEAFITEKQLKDLQDAGDEATLSKIERVKERSYFFKLSAYGDKLMAYYEANPQFVQPKGRFNEVKAFVKEGLRDLSISRTSFSWGIPVPGDEKHVMYVWLDALTNYISSLGGPGGSDLYKTFWTDPDTETVHIVGKDILRFHAVYWPAFLMSAGIKLPSQIWAHGWLTINGQKMGKRFKNFIPPGPLVDAFGSDVLRYYLMRELTFGQDGDFAHKNVIARYNGELANGLGNLLNRMVTSIVKKSLNGTVPAVPTNLSPEDQALIKTAQNTAIAAAKHFSDISPHKALDAIFELVGAANKYIDKTEPWRLAKDPEQAERLGAVAYSVMETLRWLSVMLWPVMPGKCDELRTQLGLLPLSVSEGVDAWPADFGGLPEGTQTAPTTPLFPRIDDDKEKEILISLGVGEPVATPKEGKKKASKKAKAESTPTPDGVITFDDFMKVEMKLGLVVSAEEVPKSKKLLKLMVDVGDDAPRQILAGIKEHYAAEDLVDKRVAVVINLAPRKMMGLLSHGMVLAAKDDEGLSVLSPDKIIKTGVRIT